MMHRFICCVIILAPTLIHSQTRPNIVIIVADDLGWNDVGFHGSNQIPTPNIDALAYSGIILNNYYVAPICTPSRSALMTGRHPIHTGMQHTVLYGQEPRGLPLSEKLLPEYLREINYTNYAIGKWHLGFYKKEYTPTFRGFDYHMGFWSGHQDYYDHTAVEFNKWGLDMRRVLEPAWDLHGKYSTDLFTDEAVRLIESHNSTNPMFLYLAHAAVHSANPYNPLPAPEEIVASFNISDYRRRRFAAVLKKLDDSVGAVTRALYNAGILENSIIVFTTDNGGPAAGFNLNAASNWPLRGVKNTLWEGGVRGAGFVWSPLIKNPSRVNHRLFHITDWLPSLLSAVSYDKPLPQNIDGINNWAALSKDSPSLRDRVLHNIDDIWGSAAITIGDWKLLKGENYKDWNDWYGPDGRENNKKYDTKLIRNSPAGIALANIGIPLYDKQINDLRQAAEIKCGKSKYNNNLKCEPTKKSCLFNIHSDPCELDNVANIYPSILEHLEKELESVNATSVLPGNQPLDPAGLPEKWNYLWTNFGDYGKQETNTEYSLTKIIISEEEKRINNEKADSVQESIMVEANQDSVNEEKGFTKEFPSVIQLRFPTHNSNL